MRTDLKPPFQWRQHGGMQVRYNGAVRTDDGPRESFAVLGKNDAQYFGEFVKVWGAGETSYSVKVVSFGYVNQLLVGIPSPGARARFSVFGIGSIRRAIAELFGVDGERPFPLDSSGGAFTGRVRFEPGWIRLRYWL